MTVNDVKNMTDEEIMFHSFFTSEVLSNDGWNKPTIRLLKWRTDRLLIEIIKKNKLELIEDEDIVFQSVPVINTFLHRQGTLV